MKLMNQLKKYKTQVFLGLSLWLGSLFVISFAQTTLTPSEKLITLLRQAKTYQADFWQSAQNVNTIDQSCAYGKLYLQQPGHLLWQVMDPVPCPSSFADLQKPFTGVFKPTQLILTAQDQVKIYQPMLEQVLVRSLKNLDGAVPVKLLTNVNQAALSAFNISEKGDVFTLIPKQSQNSLIKAVQIYFDHGRLQRMQVLTPLGQSSDVRFVAVKFNQKLPAGIFKLQVPKGTDVIGAGTHA